MIYVENIKKSLFGFIFIKYEVNEHVFILEQVDPLTPKKKKNESFYYLSKIWRYQQDITWPITSFMSYFNRYNDIILRQFSYTKQILQKKLLS